MMKWMTGMLGMTLDASQWAIKMDGLSTRAGAPRTASPVYLDESWWTGESYSLSHDVADMVEFAAEPSYWSSPETFESSGSTEVANAGVVDTSTYQLPCITTDEGCSILDRSAVYVPEEPWSEPVLDGQPAVTK